jgi:hypothetical protein
MRNPNFRPIAPLDVDDSDLDRVNDRLGVPTMVRAPVKTPAAAWPDAGGHLKANPKMSGRPAVTPPRRQQKLTVRIPGTLVDALKRDALDQRTTIRHLVLLALQKDGYAIEPADLLPGAGGSD